jgi:hypothetical protein
MRHYTLIPEDHPQRHLLTQITNEVVDLISVSDTYLSVDNGNPEIIFTFLIDTTYTRIDNELLLPLNRIFQNYPSISYRVFSCDYAADAVRKGNLYFLRHCTLGKMIYSNPSAAHEVHPESEIAGILLHRAKKLYKRAIAKIEGRYTDFPKCLKYEKYLDGAYILHQMLEQLFKLAETFLLGKPVFSKDFAEHQAELSRFAPSLAKLFNPADEEETRLQKLLYSAYTAYRKKDRLEIDRDDLEKLLYKTQWMKQEVERLFKESIQHSYRKLKAEAKELQAEEENLTDVNNENFINESDKTILTDNPEEEEKEDSPTKKLVSNPIDMSHEYTKIITDIICQAVKTAAIYCFAKRNSSENYNSSVFAAPEGIATTHYYLLVFCYKSGGQPSNDIADTIKTKTKGACTATVLVHKAVRENKYTDQNWFYNSVMVKGQLLYTDGAISQDSILTERNDVNNSKAGWYYNDRMRIASTLINSLQEDSYERGHDIMPIMLHQVVEQTCLGLIRIVLGYTPNHFSLSHLFEICSLFTTLTSEFFPQASKVEKEIFRLLNTPVWELRYTTHDDVDKLTVQLLERRCEEFLAHADLFVRQSKGEKDAVLNYYHF